MSNKKMEEVTKAYKTTQAELLLHVTDGGAIYLTDNHKFAEAKTIIRLDD